MHCRRSPALLRNMIRRRRSTPTLTSRATTDRFGHLPFRPSTMSGCSSRDTAPIYLPCAAPQQSDHSKQALRTSIACLIRFWMTGRCPSPILSIFPAQWEHCQTSTGQRRALALAAAGIAHLQCRGISTQVIPSSGAVFPAVRIVRTLDRPRTTIVIPTRNRRNLLEDCIEFNSARRQADTSRDLDRG